MPLDWKGDIVKKDVERAAVIAANDTAELAVSEASRSHPFTTRSGRLESAIKITEPARMNQAGRFVSVRWGVDNVPYARRRELGFQGKDALGRVFDDPPGPFLRPAAEKTYPGFAGRTRVALDRTGRSKYLGPPRRSA